MIKFSKKFLPETRVVWLIFLKCILNFPDEEFEDLEFLDTHTRKGSPLDGEYI